MVDLDYKVTVGAFIVALILAIIVWTIAYIEYRKLTKQRKIDWLIKRIGERAEDSGNESEGDTEELSTMVDMGRLRLLDVNDL
ncbi:vpu protein [Human immunodeficiency virus 1]|uniref:Protein Vpu n=1 Tax=Human immunodeficiency virus type 1 TaxID=11676 RepID=A0A0A0P108_HV1|nr:vpu protein [Human immunodeficiency virus 1]